MLEHHLSRMRLERAFVLRQPWLPRLYWLCLREFNGSASESLRGELRSCQSGLLHGKCYGVRSRHEPYVFQWEVCRPVKLEAYRIQRLVFLTEVGDEILDVEARTGGAFDDGFGLFEPPPPMHVFPEPIAKWQQPTLLN